MGKFIDITGQRFGKLLVLYKTEEQTKHRQWKWMCLCDCGNKKSIASQQLRKKGTLSCGCHMREVNSKRSKGNRYFENWKCGNKLHGLSYHPLRYIRKSMIHRCKNPNNAHYETYGGRGITVCDEWIESLESFVNWAMNNGWEKGLSIDRIDTDGDYCPENCHWITVSENSRKNMKRLWEIDKWKKRKKKL